MNPLYEYWYFHLPNFVLAAIMYTLLGRLSLSFFVAPDWKNYIWRAFVTITDPVVKATRVVTPQLLPHVVVLIFAVLWVMLLRIGLFAVLANFDLLPKVSV
jgi:uncharacterized protein YggT (Ycf19 family)